MNEREALLLRKRKLELELELADEPSVEEQPKEGPSLGSSLAAATGEGLSLGHGGEISAGVQKTAGNLQQIAGYLLDKPEWVRASQQTVDQPISELHKEEEAEIQRKKDAHPVAFGATKFATSMIPQTIAMMTAGPVAGSAITGAIEGEGAGNTAKEKVLGAIGGGVVGGVVGKVAPTATSYVASKVAPLGNYLAKKGADVLRKGLFSVADEAKLGKSLRTGISKADDYLKTLSENGLFNKGMSKKSMLSATDDISEMAEKELDNLYKTSDIIVDGDQFATAFSNLENKVAGKLNAEARKDVQDAFSDILTLHSENGRLTLSQLRAAKQMIGKKAFKSGIAKDTDGLQAAYHTVNDLIEETIENSGSKSASNLLQLNKISTAAQTVGGQLIKKLEQKDNFFTLRNMLLGGGLLYGLSPVGGAAALGTMYAGHKIGDAAAYRSSQAIGKFLERVATKFGADSGIMNALNSAVTRGGTSLAATAYQLQQQNPEFRELLNESEDGLEELEKMEE